jgi:acyl dehydratase
MGSTHQSSIVEGSPIGPAIWSADPLVILGLPSAPTPPVSPPAPPPALREPRFFWEDFPTGLVREFGGLQVSREAVIAFAREFDPQPFHLDETAAEASLFGRVAASGWHTCAMTMRMMCDAYLLDSASLGSPGLDHLRWLAPVFPGDTLSGRLTVLEARPMASRPGVGLVRSAWEVMNQTGVTVLTMQGWGMFRRRGARSQAGATPFVPPPD